MFQKPLLSVSLSLSLVLLTSADITWPLYSQQCRDDAGPPFLDDEETFGPGVKYHDGSAAYPQLLEDGSCAKPLQGACASRDDKKTAYLEGPIDCGNKGWYCRIYNDEENGWANINLAGDYNFGNCNTTESFEDAGYDGDGHCHGSSVDNTYYWWIRDHWHRQYNGRVRCCCGWSEGGTQPLFSRRIANRCDYRRLVTETENLDDCRDANEGHNLGFDDTNPNLGVDDIGCDASYQSSQLNNPIPEDDDVCWEIQRFGFTEEGGSPPTQSPDAPSPVASPTTESPVASPSTSSPVSSPVNEDDECDDFPDKIKWKIKGVMSSLYCSDMTEYRCKKKKGKSLCPNECGTTSTWCNKDAKGQVEYNDDVFGDTVFKGCPFVRRVPDKIAQRCSKGNIAMACRETCKDYS